MSSKIELGRGTAERIQACLEAHSYLESTKLANELRALLAAPATCICRGCFTEQPPGTACATCSKVEAERTAPVVERQVMGRVYHFEDGARCHLTSEGRSLADDAPLYTSPPAPVAVMPFAEKVIGKLHRFQECTGDSQGVDIGRHWFDLLTQLGLLNRLQRSPALWEMTQQGEDILEVARMNGVKM